MINKSCIKNKFVIVTALLTALLLAPQVCLAAQASWYSTEACKWNPQDHCPTASGKSLYELEREGVRFAAMWDVPFGTKYHITNRANGRSTIVVIWDRGPARRLKRVIDLSKRAFEDIADTSLGLIDVTIKRVVEITRG